jgi:hypothetical protein
MHRRCFVSDRAANLRTKLLSAGESRSQIKKTRVIYPRLASLKSLL